MSKVKINSTVTLNSWAIISRAVEEGIDYGYRRAHKHTSTPSEDLLKNEIDNAIMSELSEVLLYED